MGWQMIEDWHSDKVCPLCFGCGFAFAGEVRGAEEGIRNFFDEVFFARRSGTRALSRLR
jgi:tetrahydromethanopterin S-methyltransferase subunit E